MLDPVPIRGAGRVVTDADLESGVGGELGHVDFPGAEPVAVDPPASAVIKRRRGSGNRVRPIWFHQDRTASTANSAVSATSPTETQPSLLATSQIPYGIALANSPNAWSAKSWTWTRSGSPAGDHSLPLSA